MMLDDNNVGTKSDIRQGKITGNFHFVRRPWVALRVSPPVTLQCSESRGAMGCLFRFSSAVSQPPFILILLYLSFELYPLNLQLWGGREHAGHVFAKVCAPNTKAAQQTGSIPRVVGRRYTDDSPDCDIPRVLWLVAWSFQLSFRPSFLLVAAPRRRERTTPTS